MDKLFLETVWSEFSMSRDYWEVVLKNVVGFIPLVFFFCAWFTNELSMDRPGLATVIFGSLISLDVEVLQDLRHTRDSGMMALITNTFGAWTDVVFFPPSLEPAPVLGDRHPVLSH